MPDHSYYEILGVDPQCAEEEIETAYRSLLSENFADDGALKPGGKDTVQALNQAYVVLTDPVRRKQYDYELFGGKKGASPGNGTRAQPAARADSIPDWLAATEEGAKVPPARGDDEIVEWLEGMAKNQAEDQQKAAGDRRTIRTFIFISLLMLLTITILVAMMALAR